MRHPAPGRRRARRPVRARRPLLPRGRQARCRGLHQRHHGGARQSSSGGTRRTWGPEPDLGTDPGTPLHTFRRFFALTSSTDFDNVSKLWLNARHLSRYRPVLRDHVVDQELLWCRRIERVVTAGVEAGAFRCADPWAAAVRILLAIDGTTAYVNTSAEHRAAPIADMVRTRAEAELGLPAGGLNSL